MSVAVGDDDVDVHDAHVHAFAESPLLPGGKPRGDRHSGHADHGADHPGIHGSPRPRKSNSLRTSRRAEASGVGGLRPRTGTVPIAHWGREARAKRTADSRGPTRSAPVSESTSAIPEGARQASPRIRPTIGRKYSRVAAPTAWAPC